MPKAVYVLKRWAEWQSFSSASNDVYAKAARNLVAANASGEVQDNLRFSKRLSKASQDSRRRYD